MRRRDRSSLPLWSFLMVVLSGVLVAVDARAQDADGDGVLDGPDNCNFAYNPNQFDSNGDGFGNDCDADYNNDGIVGAPDFGLFIPAIGLTNPGTIDFDACDDRPPAPPGPPAPQDRCIFVWFKEYFLLATSFGGPPGP